MDITALRVVAEGPFNTVTIDLNNVPALVQGEEWRVTIGGRGGSDQKPRNPAINANRTQVVCRAYEDDNGGVQVVLRQPNHAPVTPLRPFGQYRYKPLRFSPFDTHVERGNNATLKGENLDGVVGVHLNTGPNRYDPMNNVVAAANRVTFTVPNTTSIGMNTVYVRTGGNPNRVFTNQVLDVRER